MVLITFASMPLVSVGPFCWLCWPIATPMPTPATSVTSHPAIFRYRRAVMAFLRGRLRRRPDGPGRCGGIIRRHGRIAPARTDATIRPLAQPHAEGVMPVLSRRQLLKMGAGAAVLSAPGVPRAQGKDVVMLGLWSFTGAFADVGPILDRGTKMALEERGMKAAGRPIKYITRDDETKAGSATRRAEEAIDGEGAKYIIGPWSSGVALAVSEVAKRKKVLHYFSGGTEDISGSRCHRYSFQWAASPYTAAKTVVDNFMKANPKAKRWHLLVADYAFGWSVEKYVKEVGKDHGIEFVGADRHHLGEREF